MMNDFACNLKKLRIESTLSQNELVDCANDRLFALYGHDTKAYIDRVSLSKAENKSIILIPEHVDAVATILCCTPHDIYPTLYSVGGDSDAE